MNRQDIIATILLTVLALQCAAATSQTQVVKGVSSMGKVGKTAGHGGWRYRRRPIVYIVTAMNSPPSGATPAHRAVWHIVWCRPNMGARIGTATIAPSERKDHYGPHWVYETVRRGETRVAVNGAVFNEIAPSVPIGGVGNGSAGWKVGSDALSKKFSLGISGDGQPTAEGYPAFKIEPMHYVYARTGTGENSGRMVPFYSVSPLIRKHYPFGFGCVGLLAQHGRFEHDPNAGGWEEGQSLSPLFPLSRTLVAWTTTGDFFVITADAPTNTSGPGPYGVGDGATWGDTVALLEEHLPNLISREYRACLSQGQRIQIDGAVMFDGGPSTQIGYMRVDRRGWINLDRSAPHGGETTLNAQIPSFLYATAPSDVHKRRHRRRR